MADQIALCHIEMGGTEYNYGDVVPDNVAEAFPTAVGPRPLSEADISRMNKQELADALRAAHNVQPPTA